MGRRKFFIIIFGILFIIPNALAIPNVYNIFCDIKVQNITDLNYILQIKDCYGYFYQDYSCKIEHLNERYKWKNYTLTPDKKYVTQNLTIGSDYRIQTYEWSGRVDSEVILITDLRDLEILSKESCSKTLGQDYIGRLKGGLGSVLFLVLTFYLPAFIVYILPIIAVQILCFFIYKKFKKKRK